MRPINASATESGDDSAPEGTEVETRRYEANGLRLLSVEEREEWFAETAREWRLLDGLEDSPVRPADAGSRCKYMFGRRGVLSLVVDGGERNDVKEL